MRKYGAILVAFVCLAGFDGGCSDGCDPKDPLVPVVENWDLTGVPSAVPGGFSQVFSSTFDGHVAGYSYAFTKNGTLEAAGAHGFAREPQDGAIPLTPTKRMHIASISKTITAMAIMTLVEDYGLDIDTPFLSHLAGKLPGAAVGVDKVTIRHLLRHQSGMAQWGGCGPDFWASMREYVTKPMEHPAGTNASYSNGHFCLLRAVIETVTGQNYVSYVRDNVLLPMGITNMTCAPDAVSGTVYYKKDDLAAHGYFWKSDWSGECAAYGWYASAVDLVKYGAGIRANTVLSAATTTMMLTGGLGFWMNNTSRGPAYHHNGGWVTGDDRGYQGGLVLLPGNQNAVVLINTWAFDPIGPILNGFEAAQP